MLTKRQSIHADIHFGLTLLLLLSLPVYKKIAPVIVALLLVNWLIQTKFRSNFRSLFYARKTQFIVFSLLILFYLLHVVSFSYTDNFEAGLFELEKKLSFLILPLVFFPVVQPGFKRSKLKILLLTYLAGTFAVSLYCLVTALSRYYATGDSLELFYVNFTQFEHPTYYGMYMLTSLILISGVLFRDGKTLKKAERFALFALIPYFLLIVMLCNSRAAIIALVILILFALIYYVITTKRFKTGVILLLMAGASVVLVGYAMPQVFDRFRVGLGEVFAAKKIDDIKHWNGTTLRVQVYYCDAELIRENFWTGVGPGDVCDELAVKYREHGFRHALERNYNAHNQFLQTFIGLGIGGFVVLFLILLVPFVSALRKKDFALMSFSIMTATLFMFESMLQLQAGIMFIATGIAFLSSRHSTEEARSGQ